MQESLNKKISSTARSHHGHRGRSGQPGKISDVSQIFEAREVAEDVHVPGTDDFLVFIVRKNDKLKVMRFYQCRCRKLENKMKENGNFNKLP